MNFSAVDAAGFVMAVLSYGLILVLPGAALAALVQAPGFRAADNETRPLLAIVTGLAVLPALDSMTARLLGLGVALGLDLVLAVIASCLLVRRRWRPALSRVSIALLLVWFVILGVEWIDYDIGGGLYQSFTVVDAVKHAATTQAIHDTGVPPRDPFFVRPDRVSYYYFFYTLTALSQRLCGGLIDARATVGGLAFWVGIGVYGMARLLMERAGLIPPGMDKRVRPILLILLAAGGLDIVMVLRLGLGQAYWLPDPTWWTDEVAGWFEATVWVPHHLSGLIASLFGMVALVDCFDAPPRTAGRGVILAAFCFASAFGLSVWLTLGAVATMAIWIVALAIERRWRPVGLLVLAGLVALVIVAPAIGDLRTGRSGAIPIAVAIRAFSPIDAMVASEPLRSVARFVALPLNYFAEFGILFLGSVAFWSGERPARRNEVARVLAFAAIAGLVLGSILRSTYFDNNDLGWRVLMFPQMAGLVWTSSVLMRRWAAEPAVRRPWRLFAPTQLAVLCFGYGTTAYAMVSLRAFQQMPIREDARLFTADPARDRELRVAYAWANGHLSTASVLQHNPMVDKRVVNFGLYSRNPVGISDLYGSLYGADPDAADRRLLDVHGFFAKNATAESIRGRCAAIGIDDLVVTADDPVWASKTSWVWTATPVYSSARVRIIPTAALAP